MAYSTEDMIGFVRSFTGYRQQITGETSLQKLGVFGDDMSDFMSKYSAQFGVDMSRYLWYFHTGEEGLFSVGGLFFKPPYTRVQEIPISIEMLRDFANSGVWSVEYPDHALPEYRYDLLINQVLALPILGVTAIAVFLKGCR